MRFLLSMYDLLLRDKKEELFLDFLYLQTVARKKKLRKMQNSKLTVFLMMSLLLMVFMTRDAGVEAEVSL